MKNARAAVATALVNLLTGATFAPAVNGATTWKTVSQKIKLFSDVPPQARPALFVAKHHETTVYQSENLPPKMTMNFNLFIYTNGKANTTPAQDLDTIMDALDAVLAPNATGRQTLGGTVSHCYIDGQTLFDPGDIDGDGLIWVPIKILGP